MTSNNVNELKDDDEILTTNHNENGLLPFSNYANNLNDKTLALRGTDLFKTYRTRDILFRVSSFKTVIDSLSINVKKGKMYFSWHCT